MKLVSRASRPGLIVGFLRILCNGLCTAQRFHTEEHDHTFCVFCPNEPDSLTHYNECPPVAQHFCFFLETCFCTSAEKPSLAWLDHPGVPAKAPIWYCGDGLPWRLCLCPSSAPSNYRKSWELVIAWMDESSLWRPSLLPMPTHIRQLVSLDTCLQSRTKTSAYQSSLPDIGISPMLVPQQWKR